MSSYASYRAYLDEKAKDSAGHAAQRKKMLRVANKGLVVLGVLFLAVAPFALLYSSNPARAGMMSREEFRKAVIDKTPQQVVEAVGEPDEKMGDEESFNWTYNSKTYYRRDVDPKTMIFFRQTSKGLVAAFIHQTGPPE